MNDRTKIKKTYNILIRVAIVLLTYGYIYREIFYRTDYRHILDPIKAGIADPGFLFLMVLVLVLMALNWGLETGKWRYMIGKIEHVSFRTAFKAVLSGVSVSTFTPNRIGEYFGRVYILRHASRVEGILITILGSMSQLLVTLLTGSIALLVFIPRYLPFGGMFSGYLYYVVLGVLALANFLFIMVFFNIYELKTLKKKVPRSRLKYLRRFFRVIGMYRFRQLMVVFLVSLSRYLVFSTQFFILLRMFGITTGYPETMMIIAIIYFTMAFIPTVALTELGIRSSVAIYFFGILFAQHGMEPEAMQFGVFVASTLLWIINLAIPAIAGSFFVLRLQFFRFSEKSRAA